MTDIDPMQERSVYVLPHGNGFVVFDTTSTGRLVRSEYVETQTAAHMTARRWLHAIERGKIIARSKRLAGAARAREAADREV
jgi:hypothetical protein